MQNELEIKAGNLACFISEIKALVELVAAYGEAKAETTSAIFGIVKLCDQASTDAYEIQGMIGSEERPTPLGEAA